MTKTLGGGVIGLALAAALCVGLFVFGVPARWLGDALMQISEPGGRVIAFVMGWPFQQEAAMMATGLAMPLTLLTFGGVLGALVGVFTNEP